MLVLALVLLACAVVGAVLRPLGLPAWAAPLAAGALDLGLGLSTPGAAATALRPLGPAVGFLLAAVPLAVALDGLGFFESLAALASGGRHMVAWLWALAAVVTTVLNLDASVVLLTPLYIRLARRTGLSPRSLAFQPVLLAMLASSALPVSNLTNLIAVGHTGATPVQFLVHLGPPSAAATLSGYWFYRWKLRPGIPVPPVRIRPDVRALGLGGGVVVAVLVGFVVGPVYGVAPWMVALGADAVLMVLCAVVTRRPAPPTNHVSPAEPAPPGARKVLGSIPWGTALVAAALAVLAYSVSVHLPVGEVLGGSGPGAQARTIALAALAANGANNLPALLVALPALPTHSTAALWAVLLGVNMGPVVVATGALASLLWLDTARRMDVEVTAGDFALVGARVGLPCAVLAAGLLIALSWLWGV